VGIVLLGVPGFDRRIKLYDLIAAMLPCSTNTHCPRSDELRQILEHRWHKPIVIIEDAAITTIEEVTKSNIQKALNIYTEIERVRGINAISIISTELVQAVSTSLLFDAPHRSKK
jgi:hypothetical protein